MKFDECSQASDETDQEQSNKYDNEEYDDDVYQNHQIYDVVEIPSFVSLFTGNVNEPLYFVKLIEKGIATEDFQDAYGHVIYAGELYFKGNYLKIIRSRALNHKQLKVIPANVAFEPDEVYEYIHVFFLNKKRFIRNLVQKLRKIKKLLLLQIIPAFWVKKLFRFVKINHAWKNEI